MAHNVRKVAAAMPASSVAEFYAIADATRQLGLDSHPRVPNVRTLECRVSKAGSSAVLRL